jgi:hypothetical protein
MSENSTQLRLSIFMTPESFFEIYKSIYQKDSDIATVKNIAFICSIFLMAFGIIGNIISIFVFLQKKLLEHNFNWYLLILAIFKLIFCVTLFVDYLFSKIFKEEIFLHDLHETTKQLFDFLIHSSDSCIASLTIILSLDRYHDIKYPMKIKEFITQLHAKKLIIISLTLIILFKTFSSVVCAINIKYDTQVLYCTVINPFIFNITPFSVNMIINSLLIK